MKQIIQSFKTGDTSILEVPLPSSSPGSVIIRTAFSLVSLGTERMLVEFGKANYINKARQQPDKVKQVLDKIKTEGLIPTAEAVLNKLEQPLPLGYCNVGIVEALGSGVSDFSVGDRVASNGSHAEYVSVPQNLVAKIPNNVSDEEAAFTVIGSIGLQGIRLCNPTFGETIVVTGLGLIGLMTAQMLLANGCRVIGIDIDEKKCKLAQSWGVLTINPATGDDPVRSVIEISNGIGADGVIITTSAKDNSIISQAAQMSRKRGRIILVGVIGLNLNRAEFYEKELTFQVSCSYGPGRYDEQYEQKGIGYPLPFVRWTEKRNFEAVLKAISSGQLKVKELITEIVDLDDYQKIYGNIGQSKSIASLIRYPSSDSNAAQHKIIKISNRKSIASKAVLGIIGAGNFTKMTMLPALKGSGAEFKSIAALDGLESTSLAKKYKFQYSTTDYKSILDDSEIDTVIITTRHNSHARFVIESLEAGKHVFVEKPLALNNDELDTIIQSFNKSDKSLTVGFNRRFSPHIQAIKNYMNPNTPIHIIATMNAGFIPANVWVHDPLAGGGRIIGEACHYIDLCSYLTGSKIIAVVMNSLGKELNEMTDSASILLKFENGSNAVINYFANGSKSYSKERLEVYSQERTWVMDNFRRTEAFGVKGFRTVKTKIDKGHSTQFIEHIKSIQSGGEPLIPFSDLVNVTRASFAAILSLKENKWVSID